jgi:hypothetical protein
MDALLLDILSDFAKSVNFDQTAQTTAQGAAQQAIIFLNNPAVLVAGIILIAVTIFLLFFLKKIIVNSILGGIIWGISTAIFHVELPLIPSFVVSVIFGPAGIGAMLLLKFFGLLI